MKTTATRWMMSLAALGAGCAASVGGAPADDPVSVVDAAWEAVDALYPLFDEKEVDWAAEGEAARAAAAEVDDDEALFIVISEMLDALEDGHVNLRAPFDVSRHWGWFLDAEEAYDAALVERSYLAGEQRLVGPFIVAWLDEEVGYLRYDSFSDAFSGATLDLALAQLDGAERLVLDLRSNGGGDLENARLLVTRFIDDEQRLYHRQCREGEGLGEAFPYDASPAGEGWAGEVVLLTDARSYSATNTFVAMMKAAGHWQLGLPTGGGAGVPMWRELPNGWQLRLPSCRLLGPELETLEAGLEPELWVEPDPQAEAAGIDVLLEAAIHEARP